MNKQAKHIIICGHKRHGKCEVGRIIEQEFGWPFASSSEFFIAKVLGPLDLVQYGYTNAEDLYKNRALHRAQLFTDIESWNKEGGWNRMATAIFAENRIYVGMRSDRELRATIRKFRDRLVVYWVDASERLPDVKESSDSMTITKEMCDRVIDNNQSIAELRYNVIERINWDVNEVRNV